MRRFFLPLTMLACLIFLAASARPDPFSDTRYKVTVTPDDEAARAGEKAFEDTLIFKGGTFVATQCEKHGFGPVQFQDDTRRGGVGSFTAEPVSEKEGKAKWTGTVTGASIRGEMQWTKKDGTVLNYTYTGEKMH